MNKTTGAEETALSIAALTSWLINRLVMGVILGVMNLDWRRFEVEEGRDACRKTDDSIGLVNDILCVCVVF